MLNTTQQKCFPHFEIPAVLTIVIFVVEIVIQFINYLLYERGLYNRRSSYSHR